MPRKSEKFYYFLQQRDISPARGDVHFKKITPSTQLYKKPIKGYIVVILAQNILKQNL